jgi:hypothetical protein
LIPPEITQSNIQPFKIQEERATSLQKMVIKNILEDLAYVVHVGDFAALWHGYSVTTHQALQRYYVALNQAIKALHAASIGLQPRLSEDFLTLIDLELLAILNGMSKQCLLAKQVMQLLTDHHLQYRSFHQEGTIWIKRIEPADKETWLELAQSHQVAPNGHQADLKQAFDGYLVAAKLGHQEPLQPLERLGEAMCAERQLALSQVYASFFNQHDKADYWRQKAMEVAQFNLNS